MLGERLSRFDHRNSIVVQEYILRKSKDSLSVFFGSIFRLQYIEVIRQIDKELVRSKDAG